MDTLLQIIIKSENEMKKLGKMLSNIIKVKDVICMNGNLGAGKTYLSRSLINNMTGILEVPSPTFNLVQTYPLYGSSINEIWHCDFYRLNEYDEVEEIGVFEDIKKK
jgi:tRNA threonylcarbamoyladenosine biosynthesis protein TsaE